MEIKQVLISDLKFADYNPRKATRKEWIDLRESIRKFGFIDPIVVNGAENRMNVIIGGHFRVRVARDIGIKEVPVVYVDLPKMEEEQELNLRLNKNVGQWDWDLLANLNEELLLKVGFSQQELDKLFKGDFEEPDQVFSEVLLEEHNYVVLYFDNEIDWLQLQSIYPLPENKFMSGSMVRSGIGRVIKGTDFINKLTQNGH